MGYYVTLIDSNFTIPADKLDEATRLLKALNHQPGIEKRGGSYSGGKQTASWFSWMSENYDQELHTAREIFAELGFDVLGGGENSSDLTLDSYDNKMGQEDLFIDAVSHLANEDWYLEWRGEDGTYWRQSAAGTQSGRVVYDN